MIYCFQTVGSIGEVAMLLDNKGCIAQNVIGFIGWEFTILLIVAKICNASKEFNSYVQPSTQGNTFCKNKFEQEVTVFRKF